MLQRKRNKYEDRHLKTPFFLEKYFQKKSVWLGTAVVIVPLIAGCMFIAFLDFFGIQDDSDFNFLQDIVFIFGGISLVFFVTQEYFFYKKEIWSKKK